MTAVTYLQKEGTSWITCESLRYWICQWHILIIKFYQFYREIRKKSLSFGFSFSSRTSTYWLTETTAPNFHFAAFYYDNFVHLGTLLCFRLKKGEIFQHPRITADQCAIDVHLCSSHSMRSKIHNIFINRKTLTLNKCFFYIECLYHIWNYLWIFIL